MKCSVLLGLLFVGFVSCNSKKEPVLSVPSSTGVIAHRGAWKTAGLPENSLASLKKAIQLGCYGSEFDVQMSSDSVLFINHDPTFQNITIETTPSTQLAALKLSNGEGFPTLQQFLIEGIKQTKTRLILEMKTSRISKERSMATARKIVQLVQKTGAQSLVDYISFDYDVCKYLRELAPQAGIAYLNGDKSPDEVATDKLTGLDYHYSVFMLRPGWVKEAQEKKLTVNVWTVNGESSMKWFKDQKVDFITTDEPELLLNVLK